jgi:hypothetical protein
LYDQIKEDDVGGACSTHGDDKCVKILVGNHEVKRILGMPRCVWEDNIKIDKVTGW